MASHEITVPSVSILHASGESEPPPVPAAKSDAVAEAALSALAALLQRTRLQEGKQLSSLLPQLLTVAALPGSSAAEEVHSCQEQLYVLDIFIIEHGL